MHISYDPNKDSTNQRKHGVSLALAKSLEWDWLQAAPDNRKDYGEQRMIGYAPISDRVYCVVYTDVMMNAELLVYAKPIDER